MRKLSFVLLVCFLAVSMFSGCSLLQKLGIGDSENDEIFPVSSVYISEAEAGKFTDKVPVHLYFANQDNTKLRKLIRYIPIAEAKKSVDNLASAIAKELIKGPDKNSGLIATIPDGTELRAPVTVKEGIATVDFSKHFVDKHPGGKDAEQMTIFSVVNTLTELKEIQKVQFKVGGKDRKDFKGSFQLDAAFPRTPSLISDDPPIKETMNEEVQDTLKNKGSEQEDTKDGKKDGEKDGTSEESSEKKGSSEDTYIEILE